MKKTLFFCTLVLALFLKAEADNESKWNIEKGTHFIVYYKEAPQDFVKTLLTHAEDYYNKIAEDLGFRRFEFWLWEDRAKIYIYNNSQDFHNETGYPPWSAGIASTREKIIYTYPFAKGFFETILPHEMGHLIFREFVGVNNSAVPVWLDEGVACFQENGRAEASVRVVKAAIKEGQFIPIGKLSSLDPRAMKDQYSVSLFYAEAVGIVYYLMKNFGRDSFVSLCQRLRDGKDLETAVRSTYNFNSLSELSAAWKENLAND